jgi:hypothetical protein
LLQASPLPLGALVLIEVLYGITITTLNIFIGTATDIPGWFWRDEGG